ncbi:hypothetical protein LX36DRAFT_363893 [Colletotrichum falcatum]|nr:hypothetical protein LX36DRAFT_363893 [Colletotrichum falcatum]
MESSRGSRSRQQLTAREGKSGPDQLGREAAGCGVGVCLFLISGDDVTDSGRQATGTVGGQVGVGVSDTKAQKHGGGTYLDRVIEATYLPTYPTGTQVSIHLLPAPDRSITTITITIRHSHSFRLVSYRHGMPCLYDFLLFVATPMGSRSSRSLPVDGPGPPPSPEQDPTRQNWPNRLEPAISNNLVEMPRSLRRNNTLGRPLSPSPYFLVRYHPTLLLHLPKAKINLSLLNPTPPPWEVCWKGQDGIPSNHDPLSQRKHPHTGRPR